MIFLFFFVSSVSCLEQNATRANQTDAPLALPLPRQSSTGVVQCAQQFYTATTSESAPIGTLLLRATATTPTGSPVLWSIPDTALQRFTINPVTGDVSISNTLARVARFRALLQFRIRATDSTNPANFCESTVTVNIIPNNPTATSVTFTQSSYQFVTSSCVPGAIVGQVFAQSASGGVSYTLATSNPYFTVNGQTGIITLLTVPPTGTQTLTITARDASQNIATTTVTISSTCSLSSTNVLTFAQNTYNFVDNACVLGATVGQVSAVSSIGQPSYSISNNFYAINGQTGAIILVAIPPQTSTTFLVTATNSAGQAASVPVTVLNSCASRVITGQPIGNSVGTAFGTVIGSPIDGAVVAGTALGANIVNGINSGVVSGATRNYKIFSTVCNAGAVVGQLNNVFPGMIPGIGGLRFSLADGGSPFFSLHPLTGVVTAMVGFPAGTWSHTFTVTVSSSTGMIATFPVTVTNTCQASLNLPVFGTSIAESSFTPFGSSLPPIDPTELLPSDRLLREYGEDFYRFTVKGCYPGAIIGTIRPPGYGRGIQDGLRFFPDQTFASFPPDGASFDIFNSRLQAFKGFPPLKFSFPVPNPYFGIHPTTGQLFQTGIPPVGTYRLPVICTLATGQTYQIPIVITVPEEFEPVFTERKYRWKLLNCLPGADVGRVSAKSCGQLKYRIVGYSPYFVINNVTGQVSLLQPPGPRTEYLMVKATSERGQDAVVPIVITNECDDMDFGDYERSRIGPYGYGKAPLQSYAKSSAAAIWLYPIYAQKGPDGNSGMSYGTPSVYSSDGSKL